MLAGLLSVMVITPKDLVSKVQALAKDKYQVLDPLRYHELNRGLRLVQGLVLMRERLLHPADAHLLVNVWKVPLRKLYDAQPVIPNL